MIKELRVGNLIETYGTNGHPDSWVQVEIQPKHFLILESNPELFRGIRLTVNWFKKLGFKVDQPFGEDAGNAYATYPKIAVEMDNGEMLDRWVFPYVFSRSIFNSWRFAPDNFSDELMSRCGLWFALHDIYHVHEIQNIFFDLTGKELKPERDKFAAADEALKAFTNR